MGDTLKPHRKAQRAALWILYGIDISDEPANDALGAARETFEDVDEFWPSVEARVRGCVEQRERVDEIVQAVSPRWKLNRMATIDRNILRLGAWELVFGQLAPIPVINGCVDLGKEYGEKGTGAFINGLLDQICKDHGLQMR